MHLVLTGGGTAGHVMPNLALIELLPKTKISYLGSYHGIEGKLLKDYPTVDFYPISTGKFRRYFSLQNLLDLFRVPIGFFQALFILRRLNPDLVFSKGGYVGLPVVFAAAVCRIPIIIHESDATPGLTTKLTARLARVVWGSSSNLAKYFKNFKKVELPIREFLRHGDRKKFLSKYNLADGRENLLIMGGSLGASAINDFVYANLHELASKFNLIHICGRGKQQQIVTKNYISFEYLDAEMGDAYSAADFVTTRAGASALAELAALNKKSILIPLPLTKSRGEQFINAEEFCKDNAGAVLTEENLNTENMLSIIEELRKKTITPKSNQEFNVGLFSA